MKLVGLTGSIAAGKSEVVRHLAKYAVPIFDADSVVHDLYKQKNVVAIFSQHFPMAVRDNRIDRSLLANYLIRHPGKFLLLEQIIHPFVKKVREDFCRKNNLKPWVLMDIPLLFETGQQAEMDAVIVVSAPEEDRKKRAFSRAGMTDEKWQLISERQVDQQEKIRRADFVIENIGSLQDLQRNTDHIYSQVQAMMKDRQE